MTTTDITPFTIAVTDAAIADLKERLEMTRWPQAVTDDFSRGQKVGFIHELAEQWLSDFDWRAREQELNLYPQFTTEIDGQTIHFVHVKSNEADAFPLILTHGWPSSFIEYLALIGPLSDPAGHDRTGHGRKGRAFDVVIPSVPGYGFSSPLGGPGWEPARIARAWHTLMARLGYRQYGAVGNDVGSLVARELGILAPDGLKGVHMQQIFAFPRGENGEMEKLTPFEKEGFANLEHFRKYAGYQDMQSKRPGTLGFGLVDSPAALLAWNAELFFGFLGEGETRVDRDAFLTQVSLYWFTATGGSAANLYFEGTEAGGTGYREVANGTPTGVAVFPQDFRSVRSFAERSSNIVHWTEMPEGGHFAAMEVPGLLADDVRAFFETVI